MNYGRQYNDEDFDMYFRMQLTNKEIESILGYVFLLTQRQWVVMYTLDYMN